MNVSTGILGALLALVPAVLLAADSPAFTSTLDEAQQRRLGLHKLSAEERAALDAAVEAHRRSGESAAVADYRRSEEPAALASTLEKARRAEEEKRAERVRARIVGPFRGWSGDTLFSLDNGQVWKQVGSETHVLRTTENPPVEIVRSDARNHRLRLESGAWVTVRRVK